MPTGMRSQHSEDNEMSVFNIFLQECSKWHKNAYCVLIKCSDEKDSAL